LVTEFHENVGEVVLSVPPGAMVVGAAGIAAMAALAAKRNAPSRTRRVLAEMTVSRRT
jgi:hypothetical protein